MLRIAGVCLVAASLLGIAGFVMHPAEKPTAAEQQPLTAANSSTWKTAHVVIMFAVLLAAVGAFAAIRAGPRLSPNAAATFGWIVLGAGAICAVPVVGIEASVLPDAAAGDAAMFAQWFNLVGAMTPGFLLFMVGFPIAALGHARMAGGPTPRWTALAACIAGFVVVAAYLIAFYGGVWAASTIGPLFIVNLLWTAWLGAAASMTSHASTMKAVATH